jgi:hypothetical protein
MSDSASKYFDDLEDQEWWAKKAKENEKKQSRYSRFNSFLSKLLNF